MMADDSELEKRAVDELLRETSRARVRAETMGPAGWMKCPLRGTNKRFLINTLRSTGLTRDTSGPSEELPTTRGRSKMESRSHCRSRSKTPPRDHRANGSRRDRKHHHRDSNEHSSKKYDADKEKRDSLKDISSRYRKYGKEDQSRDSETPQSH